MKRAPRIAAFCAALVAGLAVAFAAAPAARAQDPGRPPPKFDEAAVKKAVGQLRRGKDVDKNVALLRAAVDQVGDPGAFARDVGVLLLGEKLFEAAQGFLEIARARRPQDGIVAQQLGNAHVAQYHYAEAQEQLLAAEKLLPPGPHPYVHEYLSMVLIGLQKADESEARAKRAIAEAQAFNAAQPPGAATLDLVEFELNLANVHQRFLRPDDALRVLDGIDLESLDKTGRAKAWLARAQILDSKGDESAALAAFEKQREVAPDDVNGAYEFALFHVRRHAPAAARPLLEQAVNLDPDHEGAHYNLARVLLRLGEKEAGAELMTRYEKIHAARIAAEIKLAEMRHHLLERLGR